MPLRQVWLLKFLLSRTFLGPNSKLIPLNILSLGCRVYTWRPRVPASERIKDRHCPAAHCGQYRLLGGPSLTLEVIVPIPLYSTLALGNGQKSACFPSLLVSDCSTLAAQNQVSNTKVPGGQQRQVLRISRSGGLSWRDQRRVPSRLNFSPSLTCLRQRKASFPSFQFPDRIFPLSTPTHPHTDTKTHTDTQT